MALSPPRIRILPEHVQNQIAAGEVVERPASVVKELIENALDADAHEIAIAIQEGGQRSIRVADDGWGMDEANLLLAVERHATSKITSVEDIFQIQSFGFRGEALPSIASVSKMTITTCLRGASEGVTLVLEGGKRIRISPSPARPGTVVTVEDLFFNTPARRKFLKSSSAETAAIHEIVTRIALAHPSISLRVEANNRPTLILPPHTSTAERVSAIFGRDLASRLLAVHREGEGIEIEGWIAQPPESRPDSRSIFLFLHRRWIRHLGFVRVIADAFQGSLPPRRYPFAILFLRVDPQRVDINVHPTKEQVRFQEESRIAGMLRRAVEEALQMRDFRAAFSAQSLEVSTRPEPMPSEEGRTGQTERVKDPVFVETLPIASRKSREVGMLDPFFHASPQEKHKERATISSEAKKVTEKEQASLPIAPVEGYRILGQAGGRYLVLETPAGIRLLDQHAVHERWNYERLLDQEHPVASQRMLLPVVVELSPSEAQRIDEALPILREFGFEIERFGLATLSVSAHPEIVTPEAVASTVRDLFADLEQAGATMGGVRERILRSLACQASVRFGRHLPESEVIALVEAFDRAKKPLTCPHGRPTSILFTWEELARKFGRGG